MAHRRIGQEAFRFDAKAEHQTSIDALKPRDFRGRGQGQTNNPHHEPSAIGTATGSWMRRLNLSTAATYCARWRLESVPVWLREKGREALLFAARIEARVA